jgi:glycosyltransferase involved in cell wall biosynthesis
VSVAPLVSIVVATSRRSPYLADALRSVQSQTCRSWDLIVVDDGSPDPRALEAQLVGIRDCQLIRQAHSGLATARNVGCFAATGTFVTFLDDDDFWPDDRLGLQLSALMDRPDYVGCYGRLVYVDSNGIEFGEGPDCSSQRARLAAGFVMGTTMVRRSALSQTGWFNPLLGSAEDIDFELRLAQAGPLAYIPHILLYYRRHTLNVTNRALYTKRYLREVYEHHYRLANLRGDQQAASAIAQTSHGNAKYFGLEALRAGKYELLHGDPIEAARQFREVMASARVIASSIWRRAMRHVFALTPRR